VKLRHLDAWTAERQKIAAWYLEALEGVGDLILPYTHPDATHSYHLFVIRTQYRDALQQYLKENEIGTLIHYPIPPHLQEAYKNLKHKKGDFPISENIAETALSLPLWPGMTHEQIQFVALTISIFFGERILKRHRDKS
jgi:dTDP-4-amino-4,6-dideoxygalactose transaminase